MAGLPFLSRSDRWHYAATDRIHVNDPGQVLLVAAGKNESAAWRTDWPPNILVEIRVELISTLTYSVEQRF